MRWVGPWETTAAKAPLAVPKNASTGRLNYVLILWSSVIEHGFPVYRWSERGTTVVYVDRFIPDDEKKRPSEVWPW